MKSAAALKTIAPNDQLMRRNRVDQAPTSGHLRDTENKTMVGIIGPLLVLAFCLSQAVRDVYFGRVLQQVDFFTIVLIAFSISTLAFGAVAAIRSPAEFGKLRGQLRTVVAINVTTALAWSCYFFALGHLEPAIVNTVHSGMGPLTVVALAAGGAKLAQTGTLRRGERLAYAGIALSLLALGGVVLSGNSALPSASLATNLVGLLLLAVSGASITVSLLYCKRLQDHGVGAETVTVVRYLLLILVAGCVVGWRGGSGGVDHLDQLATLALATTALIVLPLFVLQVGIGQTAPLAAHVIRALGPVFVFALQQIDGRLAYSTPTLICILAYSACAIASNLLHGWRDEAEAPAAAVRQGGH
jgi:drug/metabolite transporter (DMT)-like permease